MIQDDFMGDFYLGCPNCKEAVHFPMVRHPEKHRPQKCSKCSEDFDWSDEDKQKAGEQKCPM